MPIYFAAARSHAVADGRILPQSVIEILNPSLAGESLASSGGARAVGRPSHTHDGRTEWAKGGAITLRNVSTRTARTAQTSIFWHYCSRNTAHNAAISPPPATGTAKVKKPNKNQAKQKTMQNKMEERGG